MRINLMLMKYQILFLPPHHLVPVPTWCSEHMFYYLLGNQHHHSNMKECGTFGKGKVDGTAIA